MEYSSDHIDQDAQLQQALHLVHYGDAVLVVNGPDSSAKSAWLSEFEFRCVEDQLDLCSIELSGPTNDIEMLSMIALGFGIDYQRSDLHMLTGSLLEFQRSALRTAKSVVFITQAQFLDPSTLVQIQKRSEPHETLQPFQFVLIYDSTEMVVEPALGALPSLFEFQMESAFESSEESVLGNSQTPAVAQPSSFQVQLDQAAQQVRVKGRQSANFFRLFLAAMNEKTVFGFPRAHLMVLSIVIVVSIFALLLAQQEAGQENMPPILVELEVPKLVGDFDELATQSSDKLAVPSAPSSASSKNTNRNSSAESVVPSVEAAPLKVAKVDVAKPVQHKKPPVAVVPVVPVVQVKPMAVAPKPAKKTVKRVLTQLDQYEKQLLALSPAQYTLQLFGTHDANKARVFLQKYAGISELRYYKGQHKGKPWYMVVAGVYVNSTSAANGVNRLPKALKRMKPWSRKLEAIQSSIRQHQTQ
ncbi:MAG: hypothetical protein JKX83_05945 [Pseudomonadales bacterium]|nr:hypothetical protein [Pseudomonadales bacterium]